MEKYHCTRCKAWVEDKDNDVYRFQSVHKAHTLLSIQLCLNCRDEIFAFIEKNASQQGQSSRPDIPCEIHELIKTNDGDFFCKICGKVISGG